MERQDSNLRRQGLCASALPSELHSINPDSRVSKVFNVSCLPRVVPGVCPFTFYKEVYTAYASEQVI